MTASDDDERANWRPWRLKRRAEWLRALTADPEQSNRAKAVAVVLMHYINSDTGIAWPSRETMAYEAAMSVRSVDLGLAELAQGPWIKRLGGRTVPGVSQRWQALDAKVPGFLARLAEEAKRRAEARATGTERAQPSARVVTEPRPSERAQKPVERAQDLGERAQDSARTRAAECGLPSVEPLDRTTGGTQPPSVRAAPHAAHRPPIAQGNGSSHPSARYGLSEAEAGEFLDARAVADELIGPARRVLIENDFLRSGEADGALARRVMAAWSAAAGVAA